MKKLGNNFVWSGLSVSLVAFGYIAARFFEIKYFEISKSIDLSNILTLIVTAWLAILITTILEKRNSDNRVEKDLIITRVGSILSIAESLQLASSNGRIHLTECTSSLKRINASLSSVYKIVSQCRVVIAEDMKVRIKDCLDDLREILTNTPVIPDSQLGAENLPIEVKNSIVYYNQERLSHIEVKFDLLKTLLFELQIHINKK